jgi:hypothetical protein
VSDTDGDGLVCLEDVFIDGTARDASQPTLYDVVEATAPRHYTLDPTVHTVGITLPGTCADEVPDFADVTFVNVRGGGGGRR